MRRTWQGRRSSYAASLFGLLGLLAVLAAPGMGAASTIFATGTVGQVGNQSYAGSLGLDFTVGSSDIVVTEIGVFDSGFDGLSNEITAYIYDSSGSVVTGGHVFSAGYTSALDSDPYRFMDIADVTLLAGGSYSIVAEGYGSAELNGNSNIAGWTDLAFSADGLVFTGTARWGSAGSYPTSSGLHNFGAGNFKYDVAPMPEPSSAVLFGVGALIVGVVSRKKASA
jgi:hypothetical protein